MKQARFASLVLSILIAFSMVAQPSFNAQALPTTVYNAIPAVLPYNMASMGFQATQTAEFGDYIHLAGTDRYLQTVTVTMSNWARNSEYPLMSAAGFDHPITINIYSAVPGMPLNTVGTLLGTVTQTKTIPWRPEGDPTCPDTGYGAGFGWRAADMNCYNGMAFNLTFDMSSLALTLPDDIIVGVAYNTQTWGAAPIGVTGPYNSLNVGASGTLTTGTDDNTDNVFFNTSTAGWYTDGGAGGVGIFREDTAWGAYGTVPIQIVAGPPPVPAVGLSTTSINFGNQTVGTSSAAQTVTVTNTGTGDLHIGQLTFTSDWILSNDTCSTATVIPAGTCTFDVAFHPLALGPLTGQISIPSDAASTPDTVALSGNGIAPMAGNFVSIGGYDGTFLETNETSGIGATPNIPGGFLDAGDSSYFNRQALFVMHFNTSTLPDGAVILGATLQLKQHQIVGTNPLTTHGNLNVDIVSPYFGIEMALKNTDFQAAADASNVGIFNTIPLPGNWFQAVLDPAAFPFLSTTGPTQFRVHFTLDDNNNRRSDLIRFFSGNSLLAANRPVLIVEYYVP